MRSHLYKLQAFVIKRINYAEADKIITVFSHEQGKQTLIAKGLRKSKSKRVGLLELFHNTQIVVAKSAGGMDIITEVDLITAYPNIVSDYSKAQIAYQLVELVDKLTADYQDHPQLYALLELAMSYLNRVELKGDKAEQMMTRFKTRILETLGFGLPANPSHFTLREHIEEITERKLVVSDYFERYTVQV